jgi:hypothetical protein
MLNIRPVIRNRYPAQLMTSNPYESPTPPDACGEARLAECSLAEQLCASRSARKRWARRCWLVGITVILFAMAGLAISRVFLPPQTGGAAALILIAIGSGIIALGPHAWFWFNRLG